MSEQAPTNPLKNLPDLQIQPPLNRTSQINNISISNLEAAMRPGSGEKSSTGFLGLDENLIDTINQDHKTLQNLGLSPQQVSHPLFDAINAFLHKETAVEVNGNRYLITSRVYGSRQDSPFKDGTSSRLDLSLEDQQSGETLEFSSLLPEMISRYCFFEGKSVRHRLDPQQIVDFFHIPITPNTIH